MRLTLSRSNFISFLIRHSGILGRRLTGDEGGGGGGGRRTQRNLGEAPRTFEGDNTAFNLWVAFQTYRGRDTVEVTKEEISGDNAEDLITDLCRFASSRLFPIGFDANLQRPPNSTSRRYVVASTLEKYIGKVIKYFREVDPEHPDWKNLNPNDQTAVPEWWTTLRPLFRREVQNYQLLHPGDAVFGLEDIRPLYADLGLDDENGKFPLRICDQKHVFVHLVKEAAASNDNLQRAAIIHAIAEAIGRGGEAKFQTFRDWVFDYLWNVTNTPWKEKKTTNSYAMPRVADERWYADWYFIMGMYCMCENGLYRTEQQKNIGLEQVVFPALYNRKDESATTFVTDTIRSALPADVKKNFSAKSLRQAGVNQVSMHPDINLFTLSQVTGHATGSTTDDYRDSNDVGRAMPGINALHGKKNLLTPPAIPRLSALGADKASALKLMEEVFVCNIDLFEEGGDLYVLKETFLASLLMHYDDLRRDCGYTNRVTDTLFQKAQKVGITCSDSPNLPVDRVLLKWSAAIKAAFKTEMEKNVMKVMDPPGQQNFSMMAGLADSVNALKTTVENLNEKFDAVVQKNIEQETQISALLGTNQALREEVVNLNKQATMRSQQLLRTPEGGVSIGNKRARTDDVAPFAINNETAASASSRTTSLNETAAASASSRTTSPAAAPSTAPAPAPAPLPVAVAAAPPAAAPAAASVTTATTTNATSLAAEETATPRPTALRFSHQANQVATGKAKSMKGLKFEDALVLMAGGHSNSFKFFPKLAQASVPNNTYGEKSHVKNCLEFADFIAEEDQNVRNNITVLRNASEGTSELTLRDAATAIVGACAAALNELLPSRGKNEPATTLSALGTRINKYKNKIIEGKGLTGQVKPKDVKLCRLNGG